MFSRFWIWALVIVIAFCDVARALEADQLLLIVNGNVPAGVKTAEYYAKVRNVPEGRILKLNLPGAEEISASRYEREIVPTIRQHLRDNGLDQKVTCLVTFFGTPIRIGSRQLSSEEKEELAQLKNDLDETLKKVTPFVERAEKLAGKLSPSLAPKIGTGERELTERTNGALQEINRHLPRANDPSHHEILSELIEIMTAFAGDAGLAARISDAEAAELLPSTRAANWPQRREETEKFQIQVRLLQDKPYDAESRKKLREIVTGAFGYFGMANLLRAQVDYLESDGTVSSFDNELALLWWNYYPRNKWLRNALNFRFEGDHPQTLMVMRLDGPQEGTAMQIILASLKAEREGLKGRIVIDSNGGTAPGGVADRDGGYGEFDQRLLKLAKFVQEKTNFALTFDKRMAVLPPHSVRDVALYNGWYSVRNYVPSMQFKPGAVGYHVASFEMLSLRGDNEKGWCAGLLNDGIAATMGAVAEPYLASFPFPDEFFPLLMTGKLTLAEVYWKTTPMTSWMICCIGDPLYTPFKTNPLVKEEDLEPDLRKALEAQR